MTAVRPREPREQATAEGGTGALTTVPSGKIAATTSPPVQRMIVRIGLIDRLIDGLLGHTEGAARFTDTSEGRSTLYRLVDGQMTVCARHLAELGAFLPKREARAILTEGQIEALVIEFGLRKEDLVRLHGVQDPILGGEACQMCTAPGAEGNVCHRDACKRSLHPQWPAVYCTDACALEDL